MVSAEARAEPPTLFFKWPGDPNTTRYEVFRKGRHESAWTPIGELSGEASGFEDTNVRRGEAWEYKIIRRSNAGFTGYGHIYAGVELPLVEDRGRVILIVADDMAQPLQFELERLTSDLIGDGWTVVRRDVSPTAKPTEVKETIRAIWQEDTVRTKSVFLFGRVPVPYSGDITPDFHPNHKGAWPADVFYGEMDSTWTDSEVNTQAAEREVNWNLPGDGKFDQSVIPSLVELEVGRVDLRDMTCFLNKVPSLNETDLLRNYLNKDHNFRHGILNVPRRGFIIDYLGIKSNQDPVGTGLRNFSAFFGADKVDSGWFFFPKLNADAYLWSWVGAGGSYTYAFGLGSADEFAISDPKVVFTMFLGSYYGDWNHESNFMRASLGSATHVLTASYSGAPHTIYHHMALGETIGNGIRVTQNNSTNGVYLPESQGMEQVHISMLGDPTLRLHPVLPPQSFNAEIVGETVTLRWEASRDSDLVGYHLYRSARREGPYERFAQQPAEAREFRDNPGVGQWHYMLRAIKLERGGSGTYYNASQGLFTSVDSTRELPAPPSNLVTASTAPGAVQLTWEHNATNGNTFEVQRQIGDSPAATIGRTDAMQFIDITAKAGVSYKYRVRTISEAGASATTPQVNVVVPAQGQASANFVHAETSVRGEWKGVFGEDAWYFGNYGQKVAPFFQLAAIGTEVVFPEQVTGLAGALQDPAGDGTITAGWWSTNAVTLDLNVTDGAPHRIAAYFHDHQGYDRKQQVEIIDARSGDILDTKVIESFNEGKYLVWDIRGRVLIRTRPLGDRPAVVTAIFVDTVKAKPTVTPPAGAYIGAVPITITSPEAGSEIRYTTDGSTPDLTSPIFTTPFVLKQSGVVKARAYIGTDAVTGTASSSYAIGVVASAGGFVHEDSTTQGAWPTLYGHDGAIIPGQSANIPPYVSVSRTGGAEFTWANDVTDARATMKSPDNSARIASCWYDLDGITVELSFADTNAHRVAFYFTDWDRMDRSETVRIEDVATGALLDERSLFNFANGKYLVWDLQGNVRVKISKIAGRNAILSAILFGPAPQAGLQKMTPIVVGTRWENGFEAKILGMGNTELVIEGSADGRIWAPIATNNFVDGEYTFVDPTSGSRSFFRFRSN